jgi:hypothetical protein
MGATGLGAIIGGAIDAMSGDDGVGDGAVKGAIAANVVKAVVPVAFTFLIGWAVLRGIGALTGSDEREGA